MHTISETYTFKFQKYIVFFKSLLLLFSCFLNKHKRYFKSFVSSWKYIKIYSICFSSGFFTVILNIEKILNISEPISIWQKYYCTDIESTNEFKTYVKYLTCNVDALCMKYRNILTFRFPFSSFPFSPRHIQPSLPPDDHFSFISDGPVPPYLGMRSTNTFRFLFRTPPPIDTSGSRRTFSERIVTIAFIHYLPIVGNLLHVRSVVVHAHVPH